MEVYFPVSLFVAFMHIVEQKDGYLSCFPTMLLSLVLLCSRLLSLLFETLLGVEVRLLAVAGHHMSLDSLDSLPHSV